MCRSMSEEAGRSLKPIIFTVSIIVILVGAGFTYFMTPLNNEEIKIKSSSFLDNDNNYFADTILLTIENQGFLKATINELSLYRNNQQLDWNDNSSTEILPDELLVIICEASNESEELQ